MKIVDFINNRFREIIESIGMPYKDAYRLENFYIDGFYGKSTLSDTAGAIVDDMIIQLESPDMFGYFSRKFYELLEQIQNYHIIDKVEFISNITMADMIEIAEDDRLVSSKRDLHMNQNPENVNLVYDSVKEVMFDKRILGHNYVARSYVSAIASPKQQNQCFGTRGFPADMNGNIFTRCIVPSYLQGIDTVEDMAVESRGAVTALYFSGTAIQASETFSKKLQLTASIISELEYTDCGTDIGINITVRPKGGGYQGDFVNIKSMYYKLNDEDDWKIIDNEEDIVGKKILLRTALSCKLKNPNHICLKCYGKIGLKMPKGFNIGNWAATQQTEQQNQSLLSTKHYIVSADGTKYDLLDEEKDLFILKNNSLYLNISDLRKFKSITMVLTDEEAHGIKDINASNVIIPSMLSAIKTVTMEMVDKSDRLHVYSVNLNRNGGVCVLNSKFIDHLRNKDNVTLIDGYYRINIKGWRKQSPFAYIPNTTYDYRKLASTITACVGSLKSPEDTKIKSTGELLLTLHDVVNDKLSVHMSALATVTKSLSVVDLANNDLRVTQGIDAEVCTLYKRIRSSVATSWAVGDSTKAFELISDKSDRGSEHHLNVLFRPREIMADIKSRKRIRNE